MAKKRKKRTITATATGNQTVVNRKTVIPAIGEMPDSGPAVDSGIEELVENFLQVRITHRRKRLKNMFLADAVRDQNDQDFLNKEISKREYKGKLKTITTIKHYEVIEGDWVTEFIIDLKE